MFCSSHITWYNGIYYFTANTQIQRYLCRSWIILWCFYAFNYWERWVFSSIYREEKTLVYFLQVLVISFNISVSRLKCFKNVIISLLLFEWVIFLFLVQIAKLVSSSITVSWAYATIVLNWFCILLCILFLISIRLVSI